MLAPEGAQSAYLRAFLEIAPFFDIRATVSSAVEALRMHQEEAAHYFLIDVAIATASLEQMNQLSEEKRPLTIVIGPEEYYYLRKSIVDPKIFSKHSTSGAISVVNEPEPLPPIDPPAAWLLMNNESWQAEEDGAGALFLRHEGIIKRLRHSEVLHVEAERDYLTITTPETSYRLLRSLKSLEELLDPQTHFRIHRSHIVRMENIESIDLEHVWLDGITQPIPIGPNYRKELMRRLILL